MDIFKSWLVETYIAHRGYHDEISPENSIGAFKKAIEKGYAIELDVQMIGDKTLVAFHDDSLQRMCDIDGYINSLTKKDLKKTFLNKTEETIPTFEEVLKIVNGKTPLLIEIKNKGKVGELEQKLLDLLKDYQGEYAIQSFNPFVVEWFKNNAPNIFRGQLSCFFKKEKLGNFKRWSLKRLVYNRKSCPNFINYKSSDLPNRFVKKYKNLPLLAWTIRSQDEYMRVVKFCDNIVFEGFNPKI